MSVLNIKRMKASDAEFEKNLDALLSWDSEADAHVSQTVRNILADVRSRGDTALLEYTRRLDNLDAKSVQELEVPPARMTQALNNIAGPQREALELAAWRIRDYHARQVQASWQYQDEFGTVLGQRVLPVDRAGIYVPGGKAAYPSSVLMNAIPANVAGVGEVIMVVPAPSGALADLVLAAAVLGGVDRVFTVGGAQAIAALAYGTETIPAVDKIVGPGNIYVAKAKKEVFGVVGVDMVAGPSEILVICDGQTEPDWIAMDLLSQAEHDEQAQSILLSPDANFLDAVERSLDKLLPTLERSAIAATSLRDRGALIEVADLQEAARISNRIAPEHLELSVADPDALLSLVRHAGAVFLGRHTAEALGDFCAGPNHVLPTSATARFSSPLGVYDFQKRSSIIRFTPEGAAQLGKSASVLARSEGLTAHARSAEYRIAQKP